MQGADDIFGPIGYSWWWTALGIVLLLAVVAWYLLVWRMTRPRPEPTDPLEPVQPPPPNVREAYLTRIDEAEHRYRAGRTTRRGLHVELSSLLRDMVEDTGGPQASRMTLAQLRERGLEDLADVIETYYPVEFSPEDCGDADTSLTRAREVVQRWT